MLNKVMLKDFYLSFFNLFYEKEINIFNLKRQTYTVKKLNKRPKIQLQRRQKSLL